MEKTYTIFLPGNLIFGVGAVERVGEKAKELVLEKVAAVDVKK